MPVDRITGVTHSFEYSLRKTQADTWSKDRTMCAQHRVQPEIRTNNNNNNCSFTQ